MIIHSEMLATVETCSPSHREAPGQAIFPYCTFLTPLTNLHCIHYFLTLTHSTTCENSSLVGNPAGS